jgi:membrane fusion protein (multidrug efflux system)
VLVQVPQADISSVRPGTPATITVDQCPNQTFAGKIARDAGAFDPTSRTLLLQIDVPNPDGRLFAGMYAHARFSLPSPTAALLIPNNAILVDAKGSRIVVVDSFNQIHIKPVKLGRDFGTKTEILGGLDTQDRAVQNWMPFAGRRQSGYRIGGIPWSMREMTQEKMADLMKGGRKKIKQYTI